MDFLDLEENSGGDSTLYMRDRPLFPVTNQPILSQGQQGQPLYTNNFYQHAFAWPTVAEPEEDIINGKNFQDELHGIFSAAEPQAASLFDPPLVGNQPILSQGQQSQPLYANSYYQHALAWSSFAEPEPGEDIINGGNPQPATLFEPPTVGNQPILSQGQQGQPLYANSFYQHKFAWPPVEDNIINAENPQAEPSWEIEPADQPQDLPPPAIPVIHNNAADGSGSRPGQEFRCNNKCRGVFAGPHKCSYHGRSLTISCHGDDENCPSEFSKRNDFNRHCDTVHRSARAGAPVKMLLDCPFPGCERVGENGFKRKDNLTQHRRSVHEEKIVKNSIRFGRGNDVV